MKNLYNNKKAYYNFFVSDTIEAGVVLKGNEVKSAVAGKINLADSYVVIKNGEAILKNCYIQPWQQNSSMVETRPDRKLLLHKEEIRKLERKVKEKGYGLVPTKAYYNKGLVKIEIALAKGKKLYDKSDVLKEKAVKRDIERELKNF